MMLERRTLSNLFKARGVLFLICAGVLVAALCVISWGTIRDGYEIASLRLSPNAQRAFDFGEEHFGGDPSRYDINRAEYFFNLAAQSDPQIPYLYHELARIAFLKGDFNLALARINTQIDRYGDETPNSYYIRGLIEGYMGKYDAAVKDYDHFLLYDPNDWAAINDYSWVLLKDKQPRAAAGASARGLSIFPNNPWLLNTNAIALYEMGLHNAAKDQAKKALAAVQSVSDADWAHAYPGNDPVIAGEGVETFKESVLSNARAIIAATSTLVF